MYAKFILKLKKNQTPPFHKLKELPLDVKRYFVFFYFANIMNALVGINRDW